MKDFVDFIKEFDLHTIIIATIAFFFLNWNIGGQIDKLNDKVEDIDRRLSRIEGAFSVKNIYALNAEEKGEK